MLTPIVIDGLSDAALLFLVAVGLTMVFGVLRVVNIAHGSFFALGAYAAITLGLWVGALGLSQALSYGALVLSALLVAALFGPLTERLCLRATYGRGEIAQMLVTFGIFLILDDVQKLVFGVQERQNDAPLSLLGVCNLGGIVYPVYQIALVGLAVVVAFSLRWFLRGTRAGKLVLSVVHDAEMARFSGIDTAKVSVAAFTFGVFLAALGGSLASPITGAAPGMSAEATILAFAVAAIGGLGRVEGAGLAALIVGLGRAFAVYYAPAFDRATPYLVMFAVLLFRPQGLLGVVETRRL